MESWSLLVSLIMHATIHQRFAIYYIIFQHQKLHSLPYDLLEVMRLPLPLPIRNSGNSFVKVDLSYVSQLRLFMPDHDRKWMNIGSVPPGDPPSHSELARAGWAWWEGPVSPSTHPWKSDRCHMSTSSFTSDASDGHLDTTSWSRDQRNHQPSTNDHHGVIWKNRRSRANDSNPTGPLDV